MNTTQENTSNAIESEGLPRILISGDNPHTVHMLHRALLDQGFHAEIAVAYHELVAMGQQQRHAMVLLEVSSACNVEAAVDAALQLKRRDPLQFVGYLADPVLHASGLAGDAIFPRASNQLIRALRSHFLNEGGRRGHGLLNGTGHDPHP